jgi:hypothetical protein
MSCVLQLSFFWKINVSLEFVLDSLSPLQTGKERTIRKSLLRSSVFSYFYPINNFEHIANASDVS